MGMSATTPDGVHWPANAVGVDVGLPTHGRDTDTARSPSAPAAAPAVAPAAPTTDGLCDDYLRIEALYQALGDRPAVVRVLDWDLECPTPASALAFLDYIAFRRMNDFATDQPAPVVIDCGANIGYTALWYKRQHPNARIVAFEPDRLFAPMLRRNLARNLSHDRAGDVEVIEAAAWIADGHADWIAHESDGSRLALPGHGDEATRVATVDLARVLDTFARVDLLKIDIEGAEFDVVPHLAGHLANVRRVLVECHLASQSHYRQLARIIDTLASAGFTIAMNSYGPWRDLTRRHVPGPLHAEQYLLVSAWRSDNVACDTIATVMPYSGLATRLAERRQQQAQTLVWQRALSALAAAARGGDTLHCIELRPPFRRELGACWVTPCPQWPAGDSNEQQQALTFVLENGCPLGPGHAVHDDIRTAGQGRFSHWQQALYWSTSDNSDPHTNGRTYTVVHLLQASAA